MHRVLRLLLASLVATGAPGRAAAQSSSRQDLRTTVEQLLPQLGVPGATWSIVHPESTQVGAAGVRDRARGAPMTPGTRVQVGSVTKALVATGVLILVTRGRVDLDAPVATYLPDLPIDNPWETTVPIRVRHLLDHTAGLGDAHLWQVFTERGSPDRPLRDGVARPGTRLRLQALPGSRFSYSNTGYLLLAMLIEARTGERYEPWLDRELLAPLGMVRSTFQWVSQEGPAPDSTMAMGHFEGGARRASYAIPLRPATQFATTAADMARFARFLMGSGRAGAEVLVDSTLLAAMGRPTTTDAVHAGLATGYGLGLQSRERWSSAQRCHVGNLGTFRAILCLYPGQRAFFASYNSDPEGAPWDRVDSLLAAHLLPDTLPMPVAGPAPAPGRRVPSGWYLQRPARFEQFAYLDAIASLVHVGHRGDTVVMTSVGGTPRHLVPAGAGLWRLAARRTPTHALVVDGTATSLTDGQRTLDRVPAVTLWLRWIGAGAGLLSLVFLLVRAPLATWRATRGRRWREPLAWPTAALGAVLLSVGALTRQPFLAIGDRTPASISLAAASALLLLTTAGAAIRLGAEWRLPGTGRREARRSAVLDLVALWALAQWLLTLAWWGLLPLRLWN